MRLGQSFQIDDPGPNEITSIKCHRHLVFSFDRHTTLKVYDTRKKLLVAVLPQKKLGCCLIRQSLFIVQSPRGAQAFGPDLGTWKKPVRDNSMGFEDCSGLAAFTKASKIVSFGIRGHDSVVYASMPSPESSKRYAYI